MLLFHFVAGSLASVVIFPKYCSSSPIWVVENIVSILFVAVINPNRGQFPGEANVRETAPKYFPAAFTEAPGSKCHMNESLTLRFGAAQFPRFPKSVARAGAMADMKHTITLQQADYGQPSR